MLPFTQDQTKCTGCSACMAACPIQCISMIEDEEGFLYPVAAENCISCRKCESVCPIGCIKTSKIEYKQTAYCAVTKNRNVWMRSASGGAFSEICLAFGDSNTIVFGAAWDGLRVHHRSVEGVDNIAILCKSKYIASNPEHVFSEVKNHLRLGKKVVFCGTPCQVAGLKKYIGKEQDNLLLIDFICHGVGSPKVFDACIRNLSTQFGGEIESYEFRAKRGAFETDHMQKISSKKQKKLFIKDDPYIQLFLRQLCLRPSCGSNCHFRSSDRQGDITIADFKGLAEVFPQLSMSKRNYSSIIVNSVKGAKVVEELYKSMNIYECTLEDIKRYNPLFYRHTDPSTERDAFFSDFLADPQLAIEKWCAPSNEATMTLKQRIWKVLPRAVRVYIYKILRGGGVYRI